MKKRKFSLLLNIATIVLCVCAIAIGVYSAKQTKLSISGSIGFTAYTNADVVCKVTGAKLAKDTSYTDDIIYYVTPNGVTTDSTNSSIKMTRDTKPLDFSDLSFAYDETTKEPIDMVFTFTITNTSSDVIVSDLNIDSLEFNYVTPSWGTDGALQIIAPENSDVDGADVKHESADIVLTLKLLKSVDIPTAISGSMNLNIETAQQTAEGFVVDNGILTAVPTTTETDASITIPAYYFVEGFVCEKVKGIYNGTETAITNISNYSEVLIANGVSIIGQYAFYECDGLTSVTIPSSVTIIKKFVFYYCSKLTSITIPSSVTSINESAFTKCGITSITIPSSVTIINEGTFSGCLDLVSVTIPNSVTSIGSSAFQNCDSLTSITIPSSVTSIGSRAFDDCDSLTSITIPSSVTSIDSGAFDGCTELTSITFQGTQEQWKAITFNDGWDKNTGDYTIHCTDGDITKS